MTGEYAGAQVGRPWSGTARAVRHGELIDEFSAGSAGDAEHGLCSPHTRFQAGSISKQVLSVVVLELVARRQLQLDQPIERWLTEVPPQWRAVTLHQLLSHTSGLGHWGDVPGLPPMLGGPPERDELVGLIAAAPLVGPPGGEWRYSGPGFLVAGLVVEAVTGRPYGETAAELVFGPAELNSTTSGEYPVGRPGVAVGHHQGQAIQVQEGFTRIPGTGDLWTTTADLIRFSQALRSGALVTQQAAAQLWSRQSALPPLSEDAVAEPVVAEAYGYGTFLGRVAGHLARYVPGDNPGYQSLLAHLPDRGIDIAILGNEDTPGVTKALQQLALD